MAKDDFFVIAYRILLYLYECMKAGEDPHIDEISAERLKIPERYYYSIIRILYKNGYIDGVKEIHTPWTRETYYDFGHPEITMGGIEFIHNNSSMAKAKEALKEFKAMVPGL